ncbi:hypothetical protein HDV05_003184, partial [Chytridiales sp. JEL 0842]
MLGYSQQHHRDTSHRRQSASDSDNAPASGGDLHDDLRPNSLSEGESSSDNDDGLLAADSILKKNNPLNDEKPSGLASSKKRKQSNRGRKKGSKSKPGSKPPGRKPSQATVEKNVKKKQRVEMNQREAQSFEVGTNLPLVSGDVVNAYPQVSRSIMSKFIRKPVTLDNSSAALSPSPTALSLQASLSKASYSFSSSHSTVTQQDSRALATSSASTVATPSAALPTNVTAPTSATPKDAQQVLSGSATSSAPTSSTPTTTSTSVPDGSTAFIAPTAAISNVHVAVAADSTTATVNVTQEMFVKYVSFCFFAKSRNMTESALEGLNDADKGARQNFHSPGFSLANYSITFKRHVIRQIYAPSQDDFIIKIKPPAKGTQSNRIDYYFLKTIFAVKPEAVKCPVCGTVNDVRRKGRISRTLIMENEVCTLMGNRFKCMGDCSTKVKAAGVSAKKRSSTKDTNTAVEEIFEDVEEGDGDGDDDAEDEEASTPASFTGAFSDWSPLLLEAMPAYK